MVSEVLPTIGLKAICQIGINVYVNNVSSQHLPVRCGVPQGSILGPLFFIIYINDISTISNVMEFILFADDTNLFLQDASLSSLESRLKFNLDSSDDNEASRLKFSESAWYQTSRCIQKIPKRFSYYSSQQSFLGWPQLRSRH